MVELRSGADGMEQTRPDPLAVHRSAILASLIALSIVAWILLIWQGAAHETDIRMTSPSMGLGAPLFLAVWLAMTIAMMFPAATPMALTFHKAQSARRKRRQAFVATWVFLAGYLVVWVASGVAAYVGALAAEAIATRLSLSTQTSARIGGLTLVAAGLYQFTPLKDLCLTKCRTPISFIMTSWREGTLGALQMGAIHGAWCLGCCWLLCAIMFPLGMMSVAALATVTVIVFAEKTLPWGPAVAQAAGTVIFAYGLLIIIQPQALPIFHG
jgi:predicted metal-binding membrane protein